MKKEKQNQKRHKYEYFDYEANKEKVRGAPFGVYLTNALFKELGRSTVNIEPLFSLKEWRKIYLEVADPTEYETALVLIGDWKHWNLIRNAPKIKPIIDEWARELEIKLRSEGILSMKELSNSQVTSAKFFADGEFSSRGKTKKEKQEEQKIKEQVDREVEKDLERLSNGFQVINGGK